MTQAAFKLLYPVTLDGTETVKWTDLDGAHEEVLTAGTYWCHNDPSFTDYPSLFDHILSVMNAAAHASYTFEMYAVTPTLSSGQVNAGVRIVTTNTSLSWTWDTTGTINQQEVLGHRFNSGSVASASGAVDSKLTYYGSWVAPEPPDLYGSTPTRTVTPSTEHVERDDAYFFDQGTRRLRNMRFDFVYAAHVYAYRGLLEAQYATAAGLSVYDSNNALEFAWQELSKGTTAVVVFYGTRDDLDLSIDGNGYYEFARLVEQDQMRDFGNMLRMVRAAAELYEVSFSLARVGTDFSWRF